MNLRILGHPLNWLIVVLVAVVGGYFWMHVTRGAQLVANGATAGRLATGSNNNLPDGMMAAGGMQAAGDMMPDGMGATS